MVVDDEGELRDLMAVILTEEGFSVRVAPSGEDALVLLEEDADIDLLLLDMMMPGLTGLDVLEIIRSNPATASIRVIMVTAMAQISDKVRAFNLGVSDYLVKPFEPDELVARVRTQVSLKEAIERLSEQKQLQDTLLSAIPAAICLKAANLSYITVNPAFAIMVGKEQDQIPGLNDTDLFPDDIASSFREQDTAVLASSNSLIGYETEIRVRDEPIWVSISRIAVHGEGEARLVAIIQDISEQKAFERALARINKAFLSFSPRPRENIRTLLLLSNELFRTVEVRYQRDLGEFRMAVPEEEKRESSGTDQKTLLFEQTVAVGEHRIGVMRAMTAYPRSLTGNENKVVGIIASAIAIEEERLAGEEAQERLIRELKETTRELQDFTAIISHDLKSPLRAISSLATWIAESLKGKVSGQETEYLALLVNRVDRMNRMLQSISEYNRISNEPVSSELVDLNHLIGTIISEIPQEGFIISASSLPVVQGSREGYHTVFDHLIRNAIKYHDRDEGRIQIRSSEIGDQVEILICDDGPGIQPRYYEKVFGIFQTLSSRDEEENVGMGLPIVKKILMKNQGTIGIRPAPGRGTCFVIHLPKFRSE